MEQKKAIRDFKVLAEKISPDNVAVMAELIAMKETKILISYLGRHAEKAHKNLCRDIFGKHEPGYIFSDSYDFIQSVALFLCDHPDSRVTKAERRHTCVPPRLCVLIVKHSFRSIQIA